ncbi:MAG: hypothetical protein ACO3AR_09180, partial [Bacteroidia bacterium]
ALSLCACWFVSVLFLQDENKTSKKTIQGIALFISKVVNMTQSNEIRLIGNHQYTCPSAKP